jgi:porin
MRVHALACVLFWPVACCVFTKPALSASLDTNAAKTSNPSTAADSESPWPFAAWARAGIQVSATYIGESLTNVSGGIKTGAIYEGRLDLGVDADLEKLMGWSGAKFHANGFQIHGNGLSRDYVGNLLTATGIEALPSTRLYELWIEQEFAGGRSSVRFGQLAADIEFFDSKYDDLFVNSTFGWPGITAINIPSGGPAPPLAFMGVRAKAKLTEQITVLGAIFDGDSAGPGLGDPQIRNPHGLNFRVTDSPLLIGEIQYGYAASAGAYQLPGTLKLGGWYHTGPFDDQRLTAEGLSIADPAGSGIPARLRSNYGIYAVIEQMLFPVSDKGDKGIAAFARLSSSPSDRNLIDLYVDGAVVFGGLSSTRPDDQFGIIASFARISDRTRGLDQDQQTFNGLGVPVCDFEAVFEATYQAQISPGWNLQPLVQYVVHPAGGGSDLTNSTSGPRLKNALVFGLRTTIKLGQE